MLDSRQTDSEARSQFTYWSPFPALLSYQQNLVRRETGSGRAVAAKMRTPALAGAVLRILQPRSLKQVSRVYACSNITTVARLVTRQKRPSEGVLQSDPMSVLRSGPVPG